MRYWVERSEQLSVSKQREISIDHEILFSSFPVMTGHESVAQYCATLCLGRTAHRGILGDLASLLVRSRSFKRRRTLLTPQLATVGARTREPPSWDRVFSKVSEGDRFVNVSEETQNLIRCVSGRVYGRQELKSATPPRHDDTGGASTCAS